MTRDEALVRLLEELKGRHYHFVSVTPATHARILARPDPDNPGLRDIFGWNRPFRRDQIDRDLLALLERSDCVEKTSGGLRSRVRVASLRGELFLHSAYPTDGADAIFFGPDTYRFADFIDSELPTLRSRDWIVDFGAGSGAGGVVAAKLAPTARISLVDINPAAAELARVNCAAAGIDAEVAVASTVPSDCDVVIANPPYMLDSAHRTYRDGGSMLGGEVACDWTRQALHALVPGGTLLLYTGAAVVNGEVPVLERIGSIGSEHRADVSVREVDPDVFGEELDRPQYGMVERIAVFQIKITRG